MGIAEFFRELLAGTLVCGVIRSMRRRALSWLGWWAALFPVYLLLAGSLSWQELVAGALAAGISAVAALVTVETAAAHYRPRLRWLVPLARIPLRVLLDCGILAWALWRRLARGEQIEGELRRVPFDPGGDDPVSAARRALVLAGSSLAPNTFAISIDRQRRELLVHQLVIRPELPGRGDREWPL